MMPKIHILIILTVLGLIGLALFGKTLPVSAPQLADARFMPSGAPVTLTSAVTPLAPSGDVPHTAATRVPSPTQSPTSSPQPTYTPTPTRTPLPTSTPTPDMSILDAQLDSDSQLLEAICQPNMKLTIHEEQVVVPILLYHFVGRENLETDGQSTTRYNVTVADFDAQLALLRRLGYETVTIHDVADAISGTATLPSRPVAITVDDGWVEQYTQIYPALKKYDMVATFFIPSTYPVGGRFVTWEQLKTMANTGMEIGAHTRTHVDLTALSSDTAWYELSDSKKTLEEKLGITVYSMSYPFGNYSSSVIQLTQKAGYRAAVALGPTPKQSLNSLYRLNRLEVFGTRSLVDFVNYLPWRGQGTSLCSSVEGEEATSAHEGP